MNKNYGKHIVVIELIKTHDAGILLANGGGVASTPTPAFFLKRTRPLQVSSCRELDVVFESGGGAAPPPTPSLSFQAVQACFQEHRTIKKNCVRHMLASSFLPAKTEPIRACDKDLVFASGKGCASNKNCVKHIQLWYRNFSKLKVQAFCLQTEPTGPLHFCELCTIASSIILPAETEPIRTRQKDVVFAIASSIILPARTEPIRIRDKNVVSASGGSCARNPLITSCKAKSLQIKFPTGLVQIQPCRLQFPSCPI